MVAKEQNLELYNHFLESKDYPDLLLKKALDQADKESRNFISVLADSFDFDIKKLRENISSVFNIEAISLKDHDLDPSLLSLVPAKFVSHYNIVPINYSDNLLKIAVADPMNLLVVDDIASFLNVRVVPVFAFEFEIKESISRNYGLGAQAVHRLRSEESSSFEKRNEIVVDKVEQTTASIVDLVDTFLAEALRLAATDVHLEPQDQGLRARYRIDGVLQDIVLPEEITRFYPSIVSRIKIMAHLDISEKRLPQDGRIQTKISNEPIDIRVSTMPLISGEAVHLRLLRQKQFLNFETLGFDELQMATINHFIKKPNGIILVTGPTGSGKSTTLYAALSKINSSELKIITVEDPVEYNLSGINQIQIQPKIGFNFAEGLRHILRHDPDVIMVGEIRDRETAEIAIRSALTGHLVFSTLHTNDAASTITRLLDMDFESYLLATSLECVIAQRLVRKLCDNCKKEIVLNKADLQILYSGVEMKSIQAFEAVGCNKCRNSGYSGRTVIAEILTVDDNIRDLIGNNVSSQEIKRYAIKNGMSTLMDNGLKLLISGKTSLSEILRVIKEE